MGLGQRGIAAVARDSESDLHFRTAWWAALLALAAACAPNLAKADEGGVSFWVPGFFGSLAAPPQTPGFSLADIYYHTSVSAGADVAFARQVTRGNITVNFPFNLNVDL